MFDKIKRFNKKHVFWGNIIYFCYLIYGHFFFFLCFCMRIFPIQKNKILCCNMKGKRCSDNPMYIANELKARDKKYKIVWLMDRNAKVFFQKEANCVKINPLSMAYELATSQVWIDSNTKCYGTLKRKKQFYIQTWHANYGFKKIGLDLGDKLSLVDRRIYTYNGQIADLFISNGRKSSEIYRSSFGYSGEILECGSPRNDVFFQDSESYRKKVQDRFAIHGRKMALYAPTFREDFGTSAFHLDYCRLKNNLKKRFGGEWVVLVRLHPSNVMEADSFFVQEEQIINATYYDIVQELLVACDILITDYSSSMFDFATKGKVCFLYATDVAKYQRERGCYFAFEELPFPLAQNDNQLEENILFFSEEQYQKGLDIFFQKVGHCENGNASSKVADYIENWLETW